MMDTKGQIALEYLLMFFVVLIIISTITIPLLYSGIETADDLAEGVKVKSMLTEISKNVQLISVLDDNSKRSVSIYVPGDLVLYYRLHDNRHYIYTTLTLSDSSRRKIEVEVPCKVSFNNNSNHYYSSLKNRWYYNVEIKWVESADGQRSVNVGFK
ncbi:MAG: hypothetical protein BZ138_00235 [Methanosphaera sp. rholeuAM270]|nr:MAG: hypothetical protein BZ138_00235 [Methanosphaera sp. rholeuAM270]